MRVTVQEGVDDIVDHVDVFVPVKLMFHIVEVTTQGIEATSQQVTDVETGFG